MIGNARENIGQIGLWLDAVHFAGLDDGVYAGGALSVGVGATEEVILASQDRRFHGAFRSVVRHLKAAIGDVAAQPLPARQRIANGLGKRALAAHLVERG